jgi:secreted trypsin-like serine protease
MSNILLEVDLPVANANYRCSGAPGFDTTHNVCYGGTGSGSTCDGDSGGPLVVREGGYTSLLGVVSTGAVDNSVVAEGEPIFCGLKGRYNVFVNATTFASWINDTIANYVPSNTDGTASYPSGTVMAIAPYTTHADCQWNYSGGYNPTRYTFSCGGDQIALKEDYGWRCQIKILDSEYSASQSQCHNFRIVKK